MNQSRETGANVSGIEREYDSEGEGECVVQEV